MPRLRSITVSSILFITTSCAAPASSQLPTSIPPEQLPTVIVQTAEAANVASTETAMASIPTETETAIPTATETFTPGPTPTATTIPGHDLAEIEIQSPGPFSKVVSPIALKLNITTGKSKIVQVDLFGEDGRLISRILKKNVPTSTNGIEQNIKVPFEIRAAAEIGRLTISTQDEFKRLQSLGSVRLLLLSSGANEITTPGNPSEPIRIFAPTKKDSASGGVLTVRGDMWPFNLKPVILELIAPDGKSLGLRVLEVKEINPQLFQTTVAYKVSGPVLARLVIHQDDDRIDGLFYLYSQEVLLNP